MKINTKSIEELCREERAAVDMRHAYEVLKDDGKRKVWEDRIEAIRAKIEAESASLNKAIAEVEGRAKERTVSGAEAVKMLIGYTDRLGITKKALKGTTVHLDLYAQVPPRAYKYKMISTQFEAIYNGSGWVITNIERAEVRKNRITAVLTEEAKAAICENASVMR